MSVKKKTVLKKPVAVPPPPVQSEQEPEKKPEKDPPPVFIRTDWPVRTAFDAFIADLNEKRLAAGLRKTSLSAWGRDELLKLIGREDLTNAARMRREVEMTDRDGK